MKLSVNGPNTNQLMFVLEHAFALTFEHAFDLTFGLSGKWTVVGCKRYWNLLDITMSSVV